MLNNKFFYIIIQEKLGGIMEELVKVAIKNNTDMCDGGATVNAEEL